MVVEHNHLHAPGAEVADGFHGGGTAIHGEQEVDGTFFEAIFNAVDTQAVAFVHAVGQVKIHLPTECPQDFDEQRRGSYTVHIVIAENYERFFSFTGVQQAFNRPGHVRQPVRVGQVFEARVQKFIGGLGVTETAV